MEAMIMMKTRSVGVVVLGLLVLFLAACSSEATQPNQLSSQAGGALDPTFSQDGIVVAGKGGGNASAVQVDGKIVTVGDKSGNFTLDGAVVVNRFNANGSVDTTFGTNGSVTTNVSSYDDSARSVVIQSNGKIIVGGNARFDQNVARGGRALLIRYNANGSLDTSFGNAGTVITNLANGAGSDINQVITDLVLQPDGKILASAYDARGLGQTRFTILRYNSNGSLDTSFSGDGIINNVGNGAYAIALQADGKIIAAGNNSLDPLLFRYLPNGRPDSSFGVNGRVDTPFIIPSDGSKQGSVSSLAIQPDGKILAGGTFYIPGELFQNRYFVLRYLSNGRLDTSFDGDGAVFAPDGLKPTSLSEIALQANGRIVVGGTFNETLITVANNDEDIFLTRLNSNGSVDTSFGQAGLITKDFLPAKRTDKDSMGRFVLQKDGKIIVPATSYNQDVGVSTNYVLRFLP
jgi:uncharacterized delta-60 repeat protein